LRYQAWKKDHGRQIRKGEKGIKIIAPCKYKVELEEKDDADRKIVIKSDMSQLQTIKTMIHEMAHEKLHAKENLDKDHPVDRRTKEVEALPIPSARIMIWIRLITLSHMLQDGHPERKSRN